ncbi:MAG: CofH family radical SAM protein [SAR324 cluster bacterium]|nr:CofH family radical SAM protein [SAR324 cluster bacterium]
MHAYLKKVLDGGRLSVEEGLEVLTKFNWLDIAKASWEFRCQKHGDQTTSYTMFRVVNYTNACVIDCKFCSFQRDLKNPNVYVLDKDTVSKKVEEALAQGADQMFFQGGVHPELPLGYYTDILSHVKQTYGIHIRAFSPVEILWLSKISGLSIDDLLLHLKQAGLDSVPGAGAELLVERMRQMLSPEKCTVAEWCSIMEQCHRHGLHGTATMVVGGGETLEEVVQHLDAVRTIQDHTGGFHAFIPWLYQQQTKRFKATKMRPDEFLKILAFSRLYLDNINNIEISVMVLGKDLSKIGLRMGANDVSSAVLEENVLKSYGLRSETEVHQYLREAGFIPQRRDFNYQIQGTFLTQTPSPAGG